MNESEFEQQLRHIQPARPSRAVEDRIARGLSPRDAIHAGIVAREKKSLLERLLPALGWAATGAAAAVVTMLSLKLGEGIAPAPVAKADLPVATVESELLDATDEGLLDQGDSLARVVRYTSVERRSWTDAKGAVTVVEVPREDVVLMPVSFQ